ncbi:MAG: 2OG-Fe(II) oxygenase family protein [Pseudomonadales bacterium]|jgi:isopenicillin N synthase-like dioxygenase
MSINIVPIDYRSPECAEQFVASLRKTGFGVLRNHPIPEELVTRIYQDWQAFFDSDEKHEYLFNRENQDGFFPVDAAETAKGFTVRDIKEYFHYYDWGQCPENLKKDLDEYYLAAVALASELLAWVEKYSPREVAENYREPLSGILEQGGQSLLRILHYPPLSGDEEQDAIRAAAHEDINLLTILPAANEPGLQVLTKENNWIDVPCEFNTLIINTGDMLQEASQGYFPSTTHRVINPEGSDGNKPRISLPLFLHPRKDVVLSDRYTAWSYLQERLKELGTK